jgi:VanZ family protein
MEMLQTSISGPYRSGTLGDAVANAVGALAGAAVFACRKPAHPSAQRT